LAATILEENGFGHLGFYSLGLLYCVFGITSFASMPFVRKLGAKWSLVLGALCYSFYVGSFILAAFRSQNKDSTSFILKKEFVSTVILIAACINGVGAGILWVG